MRCDAVIAISIQHGTGNEELLAGDAAMAKKYAAKRTNADKPVQFIYRPANLGDVGDVVDEVILTHRDELKKLGSVGLYWALHGNHADTIPSAVDLAGLTYRFYAGGITFRKINLSACYSAGQATQNVDLNASVLNRFCTTLSHALSQEGNEAELDKLMVAGYREVIVMWDESEDAHPYFRNSPVKATADVVGVHNTFKNNNQYHPMRPLATAQQVEGARDVMLTVDRLQKLGEKKDKREKLTLSENKELKGLAIYKGAHKAERELFEKVARYVLGKLVLKYDATSNDWAPASLAEYSDSLAIQQIVTHVEPLVGQGLAAHIKL